jgi:hypothetical protein
MMRATTKRRWKFRGICADAVALGVNRSHLYRVLSRERPGKSLLARYHALKGQTATEAHNSSTP